MIKLNNLVYELIKLDKAIVFQIQSMNNKIKGNKDSVNATCLEIDNTNCLVISGTYPYLRVDTESEMVDISLQTTNDIRDEEDNIVSVIYFETNFKRDEICRIIQTALQIWDEDLWDDEVSKYITVETKLEHGNNVFKEHLSNVLDLHQDDFDISIYLRDKEFIDFRVGFKYPEEEKVYAEAMMHEFEWFRDDVLSQDHLLSEFIIS